MAGTAVGDTNEPTSMRPTPVADSASTSRTRASTGRGASLCSPSRGPTSRMLTDPGNRTGRSYRPGVGRHLAVDLELDRLRVADVGEGRLAVLAGRLDHQVADADQPLEHRLGEGHVVDPLQGDLAAELGDH